jgi:plasmid stabilization system protein ParE
MGNGSRRRPCADSAMKYTLVFRRIAGRELEDAAEYYEEQSEGLGVKFLDTVKEALQRVCDNPLIYAIEHNEIRAAKHAIFPTSSFIVLKDRVSSSGRYPWIA